MASSLSSLSQPTTSRRADEDSGSSADLFFPRAKKKKHVSLDIGTAGTLRVRIRKTHSALGIAIEGGMNTVQVVPRIISVSPNGAAFESGGLSVGQSILEVDGQSTTGKTHSQVAQLIARQYSDPSRSDIVFLVMDPLPPGPSNSFVSRQGTPLIIGEDVSEDFLMTRSGVACDDMQ